jgi:hypothetical protein
MTEDETPAVDDEGQDTVLPVPDVPQEPDTENDETPEDEGDAS